MGLHLGGGALGSKAPFRVGKTSSREVGGGGG